jgi:hypothetical protein
VIISGAFPPPGFNAARIPQSESTVSSGVRQRPSRIPETKEVKALNKLLGQVGPLAHCELNIEAFECGAAASFGYVLASP